MGLGFGFGFGFASPKPNPRSTRQGPPLNSEGNTGVDVGALVLPGEI